MSKRISGTKEWAVVNVNCVEGCGSDCKYCYSRYNAIDRFGLVKYGEWTKEVVQENSVNKTRKLEKGVVMFPSAHDIRPSILEPCLKTIKNILKPGNKILIVSKPHLDCITRLCDELTFYKNKILFRFTIGSMNNEILKYWEPNVPLFEERFDSLKLAFTEGYNTSISCEPMLDSNNVVNLFYKLVPFVTNTIWIGKMNGIDNRVKINTEEERLAVNKIEEEQQDKNIFKIYNALKHEEKIRWKDSIKEVIGLEDGEKAGMDF